MSARRLAYVLPVLLATLSGCFGCGGGGVPRDAADALGPLGLRRAPAAAFLEKGGAFEVRGAKAASAPGRVTVRVGGLAYSARFEKGGALRVERGGEPGLTLTPDRGLGFGDPELREGRVMFPALSGRALAVETATSEGVKEDLVLGHPVGGALAFSWKLALDAGLEAKLAKDGGVEVSEKGRVLYRLPAPELRQNGGGHGAASARFALDKGVLTLTATGLESLAYPISIDPTVTVTSTADFALGGNLEMNDDVDATGGGRLLRRQFGGATLGAALSTSGYNFSARAEHAVVAYDGYLYQVGGTSNGSDYLGNLQYVAPSGGTFGATTTNATTFTPRKGLGAVIYDGYLYVVGGETAPNTTTTLVEFAKVNADGSVGAFSATSALPTPRKYFGIAASKGWLYVLCGTDGAATPTVYGDVLAAPFKPDGTLGSWSTLPTTIVPARYAAAAAIYDDTLYLTGGITASGGYRADVLAAPIPSPGVVGPFANLGSFPTPRGYHAMAIYDGLVAVLGGDGGSGALSDIEYADIYASGNPGLGGSLPAGTGTATRMFGAAAMNGTLYYSGGESGTMTSPTMVTHVGAYSYMNGPTVTSTNVVNNSTYSVYQHTCNGIATWNGFLYIIAGEQGGATAPSEITRLNADGTVQSPFTVLSGVPAAINCNRALVYDSVLYVIGSWGPASGTYNSLIWWAALDPITGQPTTWNTSATTYPFNGRSNYAVAAHANNLYVLGGTNSGNNPLQDGYYIPIGGVNGAPSTTATYLPNVLSIARAAPSATTYNGLLYVGGASTSSPFDILTFTSTGGLTPSPLSPSSAVMSNVDPFSLFSIDGRLDQTSGAQAWQNFLAIPDGELNAGFTVSVGNLNNSRSTWQATAVASNGFVTTAGGGIVGSPGAYNQAVQSAPAGVWGYLNAWTSVANSTTRSHQCTATWGNFIYQVGGTVGATTYTSDVVTGAVASNGSVTWTTTTSSSFAPRRDAACAAYNGYLYVLSGETGAGTLANDLLYAPLDPVSGAPGAWTATSAYPSARKQAGMAAMNGYLFVVGGADATGAGLSDGSELVLGSNGAPSLTGTWTNLLPSPTYGLSLVANGGYLVAVGGYSSAGGTTNAVLSSQPGPNTFPAFAQQEALPIDLQNAAAAAYAGHVYVAGGYTMNSAYQSTLLVGSLLANGGVGSWLTVPAMPGTLAYAGAGVAHGYLLVTGGESGGTQNANVYESQLVTPAPRAVYSKLVDFGTVMTSIDKLTVNGTFTRKGVVVAKYAVPVAGGQFAAPVNLGAVPLGTAVPIGATNVRYLWLELDLDDSTALFANEDATARVERDVTDFSLDYTPPPPTELAFGSAPQTVPAGTCSGPITVNTADSTGYPVPVAANTAITLSGPGTLYTGSGCATAGSTVNLAPGQSSATFSILATAAGSYSLAASSTPALTGASQSFTVSPGTPTSLAFVQQPTNVTAGKPITPAVTLKYLDAYGNQTACPGYSVGIALGSNPGGGTLSGTTSSCSGGLITFPSLSVNKAGTGYTLVVTSSTLTATSAGFNVTPDVATAMAWTTQPPASVTAGASMSPAPAVTLLDQYGNVATTSSATITLSIKSGPAGGALSGSASLPTTNGVAIFGTLSVNVASATQYVLNAAATGFTTVASNAFTCVAGAPTQLVFASAIANTTVNTAFYPAVKVEDASGNVVTAGSYTVTFAFGNNPTGATLGGTTTCTTSGGACTDPGVWTTTAGTGYTVTATATGLSTATSNAFDIAPGAVNGLAWTRQPVDTVAGVAISPAPQVSLVDAWGNVVTTASANITVTEAGSGAAVGGTSTVATAGGVATFSNIWLTSAGTHVLWATRDGTTQYQSLGFNILPAAAASIAWTIGPLSTYAGSPIGNPSLQVTFKDAYGNTTQTGSAAVTLSFANNAGGGTLNGTLTQSPVSGVASFPNIYVDKVGTGYTLNAAATGFTTVTSAAFNITAGAPYQLVWSTQPSSGTATANLPTFAVQEQDQFGNPCTTATDSVTVTMGANPGNTTLAGTLTATASGGIASFGGVQIHVAANGYTLFTHATLGGTTKTSAASNAFNVAPGPAANLYFNTQPSNTAAGAAINPPPSVLVGDAYGNPVTTATNTITVSLGTNPPPGGTLSGTTSATPSNGVASFGTLSINTANTGYTLVASSSGFSNVTSSAFNVTPGTASALVLGTAPGSPVTAGTAWSAATVKIADAYGNTVTTATNAVTLVPTGPGAVSGTLTQSAASGVATFSGLSATVAGAYSVTASATGLAAPSSPSAWSVTVNPAAGSKLVFSQQPPASVAATSTFTAQVQVQDQYGNTVTAPTQTVSLALLPSGTLSGTTSIGNPFGLTTYNFNNLAVHAVGSGYSLQATATGLTSATSTSFSVTPGPTTKLNYAQQPTNVAAGAVISPAVTLTTSDAYGNPTTGWSSPVTMAIGTNPGSATLGGTLSQPISTGTAAFADLTLDKAANGYTLSASTTSGGVTLVAGSNAFNVTPGAASVLAFSSSPQSVSASYCSTNPVVLQTRDANGNPSPVASALAVSLSAQSGNLQFFSDSACGTSIPGVTVSAGASTAQFWFHGSVAGNWTVTASSSLGNPAQTESVLAAGPAKLVFITAPQAAVPAATCSGVVTVQTQDTPGNVAPVSSATTVTLAAPTLAFFTDSACSTSAGGQVVIAAGQSTASFYFTGGPAGSYAVTASSGSLAQGTQSEGIVAGTASRLAFTDAAPSLAAGACSPLRTVQSTDAAANPSPVGVATTLDLAATGGGLFYSDASCQNAVATVQIAAGQGTASFYYRLTAAGTQQVTASDATSALLPAIENPVVTAGAPTQIAFAVQPSNVVAGAAMTPDVQVAIEDAYGNVAATATQAVVLALANNPGGATLGGPVTSTPSGGVVTFTGLSLDKAGAGYTLAASATGLGGATSSAFDVTPGAAARLAFTVQPPNGAAGAPLTPAVQVTVEDALGNTVTSSGAPITLALSANPGGATLTGGGPVNAANGVATFSTISLDKAATGYALTATSGSLTAATSNSFDVGPGPARALVFDVQPSDITAGQTITPAVKVAVHDAYGNLVGTANHTILLSLGNNTAGGTLSGAAAVSASGGVATFSNLSVDKASSYTLVANSSPALTSATSAPFTVSFGPPAKLKFTTPAQSLQRGACSSAVTVETEDAGGNTTPVIAAAIDLTPTGPTGVAFFSDSLCATAATTVPIGVGSTSATFYFTAANAASTVVVVNGGGFPQISQTETVTGGPPPVISPTNANVAPGGKITFTVNGSSPPFTWSLSTNASGGTIDQAGGYTAGPTAGVTDVVQVTDSQGGYASATVAVAAPQADGGADGGGPGQDAGAAGADGGAGRPPLNGWGCGCGNGPSAPGPLVLLGLLFFALPRRRRSRALPLLAVGLALAAAFPARAAEGRGKARDTRPSVVVMNVDITVQGEKLDGSALTDVLSSTFDEPGLFRVMGTRDMQAMLSLERQKALMGCSSDANCMAEIAGALGVDYALVTSVGKVGSSYVIGGRLIDSNRARVVTRTSFTVNDPNQIIPTMAKLANKIIDVFQMTLPSAENARWTAVRKKLAAQKAAAAAQARAETVPPTLPDHGPGIEAGAVLGYAPLAATGDRGSVGAEAGFAWRFGRSDLDASLIIGPNLGGRISYGFAVLHGPVRLGPELRAAFWPGASAYGGGPALAIEIPMGEVVAVKGSLAGEYYLVPHGYTPLAVLVSAGAVARF